VLTQDKRKVMEAVRYFETSVYCFHCALFKIPEKCNNGTVKPAYNGTARDQLFPLQAGFISYKGKAIPLQAWRGPEGSRSLRLPDFKTIGT